MTVDAVLAGAGIWGCIVARWLAEAGRKVLEKQAVGGGNVRLEINVATQLITHNL